MRRDELDRGVGDDRLARIIDEHLEYLGGNRDQPPSLATLRGDERHRAAALVELLEATWGADVPVAGAPPLDADPVHRTLLERHYREQVVRALGQFELFGVDRGRAPRKHSFDRAYVSLAVARSGRGAEDEDELTGAGIDVASAFANHPRVLLRGGAGAGKTTLLRWLAVSSARDRPVGLWGDLVPFFLPLRQFARGPLPPVERFPAATAKAAAHGISPGWAAELFRDGRALLLLDGVDELTSPRRAETRAWLERLVSVYPRARYIVTARPFAVAEDWLTGSGFVTFDLLSLSGKGVRDFLAAWHDAARSGHEGDADMLRWLDACEQGLAELLATRWELRQLAASPLLCGLLCALYQDRNMHLPRDRKSLYEAALDLLLVRWDEQRGVRIDEGLPLSKEEQLVLLQRFAYSVVKNQELLLSREDAARRIAHAMRGLRQPDADPTLMLQRLLERTGLLREPYPDEVQFVHRTFRDYLAAREVVDSGDLGHLLQHAHLDHWHDVVVMAVAHARPRERDELLQELLRGNAQAQEDPRVRDRLHLVAAACLEQADVTHTDEVRQLVRQAATRLIPPRTLDDAELLAKAGAFMLDLLPGPEGLSDQQAACVVRTAAMVGGEGAREKIAQYVSIDESIVIDELLRAWRRSDNPEEYARTVLAQVDFGERRLDVRGGRVACLRHLSRLACVACYGDFRPLDPLAAMPNLRRLELIQNEVLRDLSPLRACRTLRTLELTGCPYVQDLSPLAATTVERLALHMMRADLGTLCGARLRALTIRDPTLERGLHPLPADLPLRELTLRNLPHSRNLLGVERWRGLERLSVRGVPRAEEVEALARLPGLRHLVLHAPESAQGLARLQALPSLRRLDLDEVPRPEREAILSALRGRPDLEVRLPGPTATTTRA